MDQVDDPATPTDALKSTDNADTAQQANRRLFYDPATALGRTPITIPPTKKIGPITQHPHTSVQSELTDVKTFVKENVGDLRAQVSALSKQMADLMKFMKTNNSPPQVPAIPGESPKAPA